ncbi:acyl-ACP thioesterase domain-containing protein [Nocardia sp. CA-107356]|uniref:acyl-ACP thioesterase domain-containing protein n=1 Tax=Nocardia sp. CA-107356 TaxID=3239972 RepID=UPI003D8BC25C
MTASPTGLASTEDMYTLPEQPLGAEVFTARYRMRTSDIDAAMRLRLDAVARYLQDIAADMIETWQHYETDPFWILRRTIIDVIEPISWPGNVTVQRWCSATSTRWMNMRQTIRSSHETSPFNPEHRPPGHIETESFCIKVDRSGQLSRITEAAQEHLNRHVADTRLRWRPLITEPLPAASADDRQFSIRATDIDPFDHVNNAVYWHAVENELAMHPDLIERRHRAIVEFLRPIPPATRVTVRTSRDPHQLVVWLLLDENTIAATATVRLLDER